VAMFVFGAFILLLQYLVLHLEYAERARISSLRCKLGFEHVGSQRFGTTAVPQSVVERGASPPYRAWLPVACCRRCKFIAN
jgi:hypothetical protein